MPPQPTDIVERIRSLRYVHVPVASELMAEAASAIETLRWRLTVRENIIGRLVAENQRLRHGAVESRENEHYRGVEELGRPRRAHNPEIAGSNPAAPTHDALPEVRAASSPLGNPVTAGLGTGNTPSKAEIDALEFVVEEGRIGNYGILRSWLIRLRPEWESQSYEESDEKRVNTTTERRIDRAAYEGDIVSRLKHWRGLHLAHSGTLFEEAASAIESLREAIRRLAEQDATLSVQGGDVTVTMDATLTADEREAVETAVRWLEPYPQVASTLRKLFERLGGDR